MDPLLWKKSSKTKYNVKWEAKAGSTIWGIPFDFRKNYNNNNPVHAQDVIEFSPNDSFFNSSLGAGLEFTSKTIIFIVLALVVSLALIIYGALENTFLGILGGSFLIFLVAEFFSRGLFVFSFGYADFELIPSSVFKTSHVSTLNWKLQLFGVSSILSLMGAIFVVNKGWEIVLFWLFFSALIAYPTSAVANLAISSRHFDTTLVELSTRFGGFYPKYLSLTMNFFVQLILFSTFAQLFASIVSYYPIAIVGFIVAFVIQGIMALINFISWNSLKFFGIFLQIISGIVIYLIYYLIANAITMEKFIEAFTTGLCYDTAVDALHCYFGSRQLWTLVSILFTFICSEFPSKYTQYGRFSSNAFFLFIFTVVIILAIIIKGNFQIHQPMSTASNNFNLYSFSDILSSVPFSTVTGLLLTHGNQSSTHYIKKLPSARSLGDYPIVIEAIYAIIFLLIASMVSSLDYSDYEITFFNTTNHIGSLVESTLSLPKDVTSNVFAAMVVLQCLNSMESLSRGMGRSLSGYKSLEKDIRDRSEYPENNLFKVNPLTAPAKFLIMTLIPVISSYTSTFEIFWNLSGIFSLIFISYSTIMGGFYSGLLTQSSVPISTFLIIGVIFNTIGLFCNICLGVKVFDYSLDDLNSFYYNWLVFILTIVAYIFFFANYYLSYKAYKSYTDMSNFPRFVRSSRVERRVGFFRNRNYISIN